MHKLLTTAVLSLGIVLSAQAQDPYEKPDESWISLGGTITSADDDSFVLDYGEGTVIVEMDDWDWYGDAQGLLAGDRVTVYGEVDDDLYELTTIEAGSVYVEGLNTYFYASSDDEEFSEYFAFATPVAASYMNVIGTVTSVEGREFTIDTGTRTVRVDTIEMLYNPMDDEGFQKIEVGDLVRVSGEIDYDLMANRELEADTVITMIDDDA